MHSRFNKMTSHETIITNQDFPAIPCFQKHLLFISKVRDAM